METPLPETGPAQAPAPTEDKYERLESATAQDVINALRRAIAGEPIPGESKMRRERRTHLRLIDDTGIVGVKVSETFIRKQIQEDAYPKRNNSLRQSI